MGGKVNVALTGTPNYSAINDNNTSTYKQVRCSGDGCTTSMTGLITFSSAIYRISNLQFYLYLDWGGSSSRYGGYANIALQYGGSWHELPHTWDTVPGSIRDWGYTPPGNITLTATGPWYNVTAIRTYLWGKIGGHTSNVTLRVREMKAWGYIYQDIGLRYYSGSVKKKILCKTLESTDKLRIRKSGVTYGIDLIPTTDDLASNIRIYANGTKYSIPVEAV